ncbi:HTH-type transcriptional regulator [Jannaschia seosinensis]|uniref:HTH-type transcriptional regulator n=1 Tax=Jannaschia seosinensis TaxID=313367 RepID=A0A0M7BEF0_9RHOB|nr:HTH-type transcriptional regulator [Jannaschia seosinensis]
MSHDAILTALADPTRRAVLERLRDGPMPVGRIADALPVSRPAVSQHLRVLRDAGLVSVRSQGTRNLYALAGAGAAPLVEWLSALFLSGKSEDEEVPDLPGLTRGLSTRLTPAEAWQLFCEDIAIWWPVARVSLSARSEGALPQVITLDARPGGALREVLFDGSTGDWATVREISAPTRLVLDWHLGIPTPSTVTLWTQAEQGGSRLMLHDESEATGELWDAVLERFSAAANSSLSNF